MWFVVFVCLFVLEKNSQKYRPHLIFLQVAGSNVGASGLLPGNYVQPLKVGFVVLCVCGFVLTRSCVQQVRAKYPYQARKSDELTYNKGTWNNFLSLFLMLICTRTGDIINVRKQGKNWWIGELNGVTGAFAITYVEEL